MCPGTSEELLMYYLSHWLISFKFLLIFFIVEQEKEEDLNFRNLQNYIEQKTLINVKGETQSGL